MFTNYMLAGAGCFLGGCLRYFFSQQWNTATAKFPVGTLVANLLGACLIGYFFSRFSQTAPMAYLFLATGFCGGLTTFSTFSSEVTSYFTKGKTNKGFYYWLGSFFGSLAAVILGVFLGH